MVGGHEDKHIAESIRFKLRIDGTAKIELLQNYRALPSHGLDTTSKFLNQHNENKTEKDEREITFQKNPLSRYLL